MCNQLVGIDFAVPLAPGQRSRPVYRQTTAPVAVGFTNNGETIACSGAVARGYLDTFEPN